jgi:hypothetical protein
MRFRTNPSAKGEPLMPASRKLFLSDDELHTLVKRLRATQVEADAEQFEEGRKTGIEWGLNVATQPELERLAELEGNVIGVDIEEDSLGGFLDRRGLDLTNSFDQGIVQGAQEVWENAERGGI